jgi:hypothetical protein
MGVLTLVIEQAVSASDRLVDTGISPLDGGSEAAEGRRFGSKCDRSHTDVCCSGERMYSNSGRGR